MLEGSVDRCSRGDVRRWLLGAKVGRQRCVEEIAVVVCWKAALIAAANQRGECVSAKVAKEGDDTHDDRGGVRLWWTEEKGRRWCRRRQRRKRAAMGVRRARIVCGKGRGEAELGLRKHRASVTARSLVGSRD
ncbi:hypothetical protein BHM03_00020406 [Ensete ventricosum]|nr:hypothetical protein BHM03_00020406 [Ensete ventricosum]